MKNRNSKKGFTLVEIMIVVVIIGLLAAMAIPAFTKVRQNSRQSAMKNDARQLASAAQQYFLETNQTSVATNINTTTGAVTGDLSAYVKKVGTGYVNSTVTITADATFTLGHPLAGTLTFNSEGQLN